MLLQLFKLSLQKKVNTLVSIPQAVGAVATEKLKMIFLLMNVVSIPQAVGAVAT